MRLLLEFAAFVLLPFGGMWLLHVAGEAAKDDALKTLAKLLKETEVL